MDPNAVVLEISSDEEGAWDDHVDKGIINGTEDYNWIADILDEVNRGDCRYDDGGDDSDEVVLVGEVLPKKPRKKLAVKSSALVQFDDDCVVLDHDPDKPPEARRDDPTDRVEDDEDDDDDIVVVSEKGQVACRDYPHSRHLCIKFPFSSTPKQTHCDQCYCYVCDSLAPCIYWGNGSGGIDHCLATDKSDFWKVERQNSKNVGKDTGVPPLNPVPVPAPQTPSIDHNQTLVPNPIRACPVTSSYVVPNIVNQDRSSFLSSRNKYQPGLVSQQLTRASSCTIPGSRVHHNYDLATPLHRPVFKRTASDVFAFAPTANQYSYSSYYRGNYRNTFTSASQPNIVNTPVTFSPRSNTPFDLSPNFQPSMDPRVEPPVLFQPNPIPLSSQAQGNSSLPQYTVPSEASRQESQRSAVDPKFFQGISWPQSQINQQQQPQPDAQSSLLDGVGAVGATNQPPLASGSGGAVDYEFDNWMFNPQPCEAGSMGSSGQFGLSEFSPDPGFMDSAQDSLVLGPLICSLTCL
ncbi:hypothetical protein HanRHA438_Chr04g0179591 [Helianthus annuus]|uniref:RPM1 interacting protein 13 n=1 Tax=Helianthus annuus TaxID=4232 RepID=A0A251UYC8_HELAN|nr:uncharacterized protein LOC110936486 isoform X1 [Helianthus annuus]KAF5810479.1 hypothetical protein HanXRQr2_Chr04g0169961 [Helianthus annuus]KAJ0927161.1 hypothetical protein HanRHA438_Chr04g0179591 [Helianthus annuus]KAJ0931587.1 hypothetical protein HanPSC8_Chr04g0163491 [Helianthus annuus]